MPSMVTLPYLRAWRVTRQMSMRELAKQAGVSTNTLERLEKGETRAYAQTIGKLAKALRVRAHVLVSINPEDIDTGDRRGAA